MASSTGLVLLISNPGSFSSSERVERSLETRLYPLIKKQDWIEEPIVCTRQNLKRDYFDRRHSGETTALDLRSEDCKSKIYKPLVENPSCCPSHRCFVYT